MTAPVTGSTTVAFDVELTNASTADTVVDYKALPGVGANDGKTYFDATDFGGILPFGTVVVAAGSTIATVDIDLPGTALGSAVDKWLMVGINSPAGDAIFAPTAQSDIVNGATEAGLPPIPAFELLANSSTLPDGSHPTLVQTGSAYTVDLGTVLIGTTLTRCSSQSPIRRLLRPTGSAELW